MRREQTAQEAGQDVEARIRVMVADDTEEIRESLAELVRSHKPG
jgi:hypothetical protein